MNHVARVPVLLYGAVDEKAQAQGLRVGHFVRRDDPRTGGTAAVEALALEVLAAPAALDVARRDVVQGRVAEDQAARTGALDVGAPLADDDRKLDLPVDFVAYSGIDGDVGERLGQGRDRLGEDRRRARLAALRHRGPPRGPPGGATGFAPVSTPR